MAILPTSFANIINYPPSDFAGIVALQIKNRPEHEPLIITTFQNYLAQHPNETTTAGSFSWSTDTAFAFDSDGVAVVASLNPVPRVTFVPFGVPLNLAEASLIRYSSTVRGP